MKKQNSLFVMMAAGVLGTAGNLSAAPQVWSGATGTWDTSALNWDVSTAWVNGNSAVFNGTGVSNITTAPGITLTKGVNDDNSGSGDNVFLFTSGNYVFSGDILTMTAAGGDNKIRTRNGSTSATFNQQVQYQGGNGGAFRLEASDGSTITLNAGFQSGNVQPWGTGSEQMQLGWYSNGTINIGGGTSYASGLRSSSNTTNISGGAQVNASYLRIDDGTMNLTGASSRLYLEESSRGNGIIIGGQNNTATLHVADGEVQSNGGIVVMNISDTNNTSRVGTLQIDGGRVTAGNMGDTGQKGGRAGITLINGDGNGGNGSLNDPTQTAVFNMTGGVVTTPAINFGSTADTVDSGVVHSTAGNPVGQSATVNISGGSIFIGQYGIVKNDSLLTTSINLSGGTVGAYADWASSHGMNLSNTTGTFAFRAANEAGDARNIALSGALVGTGGFRKTGDGVLTLSGANTYTGNTIIDAGTFTLADTGSLVFNIGLSGVNNSITGTGIANIDGDFTFTLSDALATSGTWTILDASTLTETFGTNFSVLGWTSVGSNLWTFNNYSFDESTGILTAVPEPSTYALLAVGGFGLWALRRKKAEMLKS